MTVSAVIFDLGGVITDSPLHAFTAYEREAGLPATIACSATDWLISASVRAFEGEDEIFEKTFEKKIPRDFM